MTAVYDKRSYTWKEYRALELETGVKHEWHTGRVYAMAGARPKHNMIAGNVARALGNRLESQPCGVLPSDQRIYVESTDFAAYPDVTVFCGKVQYSSHGDALSITNPKVIVEVLSRSTEAYDRGAKFSHYKRLESLREYELVATDRFHVDHFQREADGTWRQREFTGRDAIVRMPSLDASVPLREIYAKIELLAQDEDDAEEESPHPPGVGYVTPKRS